MTACSPEDSVRGSVVIGDARPEGAFRIAAGGEDDEREQTCQAHELPVELDVTA
jgi:hypothetical protein